MNEILIRNVQHQCEVTDVLIRGNRIARIAPGQTLGPGAEIIDGTGKAIMPPFYNTHNHAAMTLLRGYADDMELFTWLSKYIWPVEAKLTDEDVYAGTRLAILEMIKSGTVFFNDMYWRQLATVRAAEDMKIRAAVGIMFLEGASGELADENKRSNAELDEARGDFSSRMIVTLAPHSIYTVSEKGLRAAAERSAAENMILHIHVSETEKEDSDCRAAHNGLSPVAYLDGLGAVSERMVAAHSVWLDESDFEIMAAKRAVLSHMPCSNLKLNSGRFHSAQAWKYGCRITIGTDGCASNNNLSMFDELKFATLLAKQDAASPEAIPAARMYDFATRGGAEAFGLDAGIIAEGKLADAILVDINNSLLCCGDLVSDMVYSADSSCVDTVICDGRVLMRGRHVENEEEIVADARACCRRLTGR